MRLAQNLGLGGLALLVLVWLNRGDFPGFRQALRAAPAGIGVSALVHVPQIVLTALAWRALIRGPRRPGRWLMTRLRWIREGANTLLPAGSLIGQALAARQLARRGVPARLAAATATVDLTVEAVTQLFFTIAGLSLLLLRRGRHDVAVTAASGLLLGIAAACCMILVQRRLPLDRLRALLRRARWRWPIAALEHVASVQDAIRGLHAEWRTLLLAALCHTGAWMLGAVEIAWVLHLLGVPVGLGRGLVVESIAQALRSAGFVIPGAIGIQEAAIVGAASLLGIPPAPALVVALVRRARELVFAVAALQAYRHAEREDIG